MINDGAEAYRYVIPPDCWHEPYMTAAELEAEIAAGVAFTVATQAEDIVAVMGIQARANVDLIRHAYVERNWQRRGIGQALLDNAKLLAARPLLIGTWAAATWAISFYCNNGFELVSEHHKHRLLARYWNVPPRQAESSVVLAETATVAALEVLLQP